MCDLKTFNLKTLVVFISIVAPMYAGAEWASDIPAGSPIPDLTASDQTGQARNNIELMGENGLLLCFVRSSDW